MSFSRGMHYGAAYTIWVHKNKTPKNWLMRVNPLTRISQFFGIVFVHPNRISQKTGSITHASRKTFLIQQALAQY